MPFIIFLISSAKRFSVPPAWLLDLQISKMGREWLENYVLQTAPEHLAKLAAAKALYLGLCLNGENIILLSDLSDLTWISARVWGSSSLRNTLSTF